MFLCPRGSSKFKSNQFLLAMIVSVFIFKVEITATHFIDQSSASWPTVHISVLGTRTEF